MAMITLKDYAAKHGRALITVRQKVYRGGFKTARKIGRQFFIDENEPYVDERVTSGNYVGFREGYAGWKQIQKQRQQTPPPEVEQAAREEETRAKRRERLEKRAALLAACRELGVTVDEAVELMKK